MSQQSEVGERREGQEGPAGAHLEEVVPTWRRELTPGGREHESGGGGTIWSPYKDFNKDSGDASPVQVLLTQSAPSFPCLSQWNNPHSCWSTLLHISEAHLSRTDSLGASEWVMHFPWHPSHKVNYSAKPWKTKVIAVTASLNAWSPGAWGRRTGGSCWPRATVVSAMHVVEARAGHDLC